MSRGITVSGPGRTQVGRSSSMTAICQATTEEGGGSELRPERVPHAAGDRRRGRDGELEGIDPAELSALEPEARRLTRPHDAGPPPEGAR